MKRPLWFSFGLLVVAAVLASAYVLLTPKIGTATRAQIDAALPASLRVQDPPDPEARRRYARLVQLVRGVKASDVSAASATSSAAPLSPPGWPAAAPPGAASGTPPKAADPKAAVARVVAQVEPTAGPVAALLREGAIRYPDRGIDTRFTDPIDLKNYAKALSFAMGDAARRGDRAACLRYADLSLRYGHALMEDGVIIDALVAVAIDAIAARAIYEAEMAGGFDASGRQAVLGLLRVENGTLPELGGAVRRDFQQMFLPVILDPKRYLTEEALYGLPDEEEERKRETPAGTFDPVATARLAGAVYDAGIAEASRAGAPRGKAARLAEAAAKGLPVPAPESNAMGRFWYRLRMNVGRNTLGRQFVGDSIVFDNLPKVGQRRAANRNLVRAVFLLRMGRAAHVPDPFGKGDLRIDPKRRIVWSVGENGKDDGGDLGVKAGMRGPDVGYRY